MKKIMTAGTLLIAALILTVTACTQIYDDDDLKGDKDLQCEGGVYQKDANLCWQYPEASGSYEWQEAIDYCKGLNLAGHSDWYLPSRQDFINLLGGCDSDVTSGKYGYCNECSESDTCSSLFGSDDSGWFWSSSSYVDSTDYAWYVNFYSGHVYANDKAHCSNARCARSGP